MEEINEVSPPGFSGTVKAMKKHPELTKGKTKSGKDKNVFALAWYMKNKGDKPHYKPEKDGKEPEKKEKYKKEDEKKEDKKSKFKEWLEERDPDFLNEEKWIQKIHMKKGALTNAAKKAHKSKSEYCSTPPSGKAAKRCALAKTLKKIN